MKEELLFIILNLNFVFMLQKINIATTFINKWRTPLRGLAMFKS